MDLDAARQGGSAEDGEEYEDRPSRSRRSERVPRKPDRTPRSASLGAGFGAYKKARADSPRGFNDENELKVEKDPVLIKFLEDGPFASYRQHWVERGKRQKKSWTCFGEDCPLDSLNDSRLLVLFNVYDMEEGVVKYWVCGPNAADQVQEMDDSEKYSPINKDGLYFEVTKRRNSNGFWAYKVQHVNEQSIADDWDLEPLSDAEIDEATESLFDESVIEQPKLTALNEIADEIYERGED